MADANNKKKKQATPEKAQTKKTSKKQRETSAPMSSAQKNRKRTAKKKNRKGHLIFALSILCILLLTFNIVLLMRFHNEGPALLQTEVSQSRKIEELAQSSKTSSPAQQISAEKPKQTHSTAQTAKQKTPDTAATAMLKAKKTAAAEKQKKRLPLPKKTESSGILIFVFDDAGHNLRELEYFLQLPFDCTIAVLPQLTYSVEAARRIRNAGKEAILHQPMQSINPDIDPGQGAIKPCLSATEIKAITRKNLEQIWPVSGMNNHEGSLMTTDKTAMRAVLDVVQEKQIFFLDSRTTPKTVVPEIAKEKNMKIWERSIFVDNNKNRGAMKKEIRKGLEIAKKQGYAILIGHVCTIELAQLLTDMYPQLIQDGFSFSTIRKQKKDYNYENTRH